ncbi:uncharacterized protein METZ01_LOCUS349818 [marine metagenome]|uniref:Uncharacterized protein n=1 Tax=marine metagenome TaxID=408172 RepID=A0A382RGW5_9ZZZZ
MSWTNPKETEIIIKNMVESIIADLELFDLVAYENIELNQQYKKELLTFFKKIFLKYGLLKTEFNSMIFMDDKEKNQESLSLVNDLLKLTRSILEECDKDPDLNNLAIKHLLNQKVLLEKLKKVNEVLG